MTRYDAIGRSYTTTRRADPRIARQIDGALGDARTVVNVGAGTGNYEPTDRSVIGVEPSVTMLRQRPDGSAPAVQAAAEALPFRDAAFDAAMGTLTVHHWSDLERGLRELQRVASRQVLFTFEPSFSAKLWLVGEYFPEIGGLETERAAPDATRLAATLAVQRVETVMVPADCVDGFAGCFWNRPEAYLDPTVQAGMSCFAQLDADVLERGMERLRRDLASGVWDERHGELRTLTEIDIGYRLVVAGLP